MSGMAFLLFAALTVLLLIRVPIGVALGASSVIVYWATGDRFESLALSYYDGLDKFPFIAVPMFLLAGALMEKGGISRRLIAVADCFVGNVRGGLAHVTILACMFFAAISGSGPATTAAVGGIMIPTMMRRRYDNHYSGAVSATGGTLGILIPPSIALIVYGVSADESINRLFLAGVLPGIFLGLMLMVAATILAPFKTPNEAGVPFDLKRTLRTMLEARWALMAPAVILGGIYGGFVTPTESAVIAALYGWVIGTFVYRELDWAKTHECIEVATLITGTIAIIWGASLAFGELTTIHKIPQAVTALIHNVTQDPFVILLLISAFLTFVGMWMNTMAQVIILTPLFLPVVKAAGVDPVHFGIIFVMNCEVGFLTPPLGTSLFVAMGISRSTLGEISWAAVPFIVTMLLAIVVVAYFPSISLILPGMLNIK